MNACASVRSARASPRPSPSSGPGAGCRTRSRQRRARGDRGNACGTIMRCRPHAASRRSVPDRRYRRPRAALAGEGEDNGSARARHAKGCAAHHLRARSANRAEAGNRAVRRRSLATPRLSTRKSQSAAQFRRLAQPPGRQQAAIAVATARHCTSISMSRASQVVLQAIVARRRCRSRRRPALFAVAATRSAVHAHLAIGQRGRSASIVADLAYMRWRCRHPTQRMAWSFRPRGRARALAHARSPAFRAQARDQSDHRRVCRAAAALMSAHHDRWRAPPAGGVASRAGRRCGRKGGEAAVDRRQQARMLQAARFAVMPPRRFSATACGLATRPRRNCIACSA